MGIVGLLISRGVRFMADGLNGPTNEEARELLEIRLEEARAQHAEDLEKLGREMAEVVAQPLQARLDVARRVERDVRTALCASMSECTDVAARRVAGERDLARAERDMYRQGCENWSKLDAPVSEFRRVLRVCDYESTLGAARRVVAERDELRDRAEKAEASLEAARANAVLTTMVGDIGVRNSGDATRLEAILAERDALAAEVATLRDRVDGLEIDLNSAVQNSKANEVEANNLRSANRTLRARVAELEAAPQGQPVATDEELRKAYITAITGAESPAAVLPHALRAVAARVRAERPACLVARAVALGVDVRVAEDRCGWLVGMLESADIDEEILHNVPAADVPSTLSRLLDEVEAARKGGAK